MSKFTIIGLAVGSLVIMGGSIGVSIFLLNPSSSDAPTPAPQSTTITGPDNLIAGQAAVVTWDASTTEDTQFVQIEYCQDVHQDVTCIVLNPATRHDGEAPVITPSSIVLGKPGWIRLRRIVPPAPSTISAVIGTRPITVRAGTVLSANQHIDLRWIPRHIDSADTVRADFCVAAPIDRERCYSLMRHLPNTGLHRNVRVPEAIPTTAGVVRIHAESNDSELAASVSGRIEPPLAVATETANEEITVLRDEESQADRITVNTSAPTTFDPFDSSYVSNLPTLTNSPSPSPSATTSFSGFYGYDFGDFGSSSTGEPTPSPSPSAPTSTLTTTFVTPANAASFTIGDTLPIHIQIQGPIDNLTCIEWHLNGRPVSPTSWLAGSTPAGPIKPCTE